MVAVTNPFVGPRSFETGETLFGRDRETRELFRQLVSERIVLLHSPSGAGKSSLLKAALAPLLDQEGFHVWPVVRVNTEPGERNQADATTAPNRYVLSALHSLKVDPSVQGPITPDALSPLTLSAFFDTHAPGGLKEANDQVLIFDQFEEVLTVDPNDLAGKQAFFEQVGALLRRAGFHAIFALRDEYVGALEPYRRRVPRGFDTHFRLDLLGEQAAREAIVGPTSDSTAPITKDAARVLVDDLRTMKLRRGGQVVEELGLHVEPVQLQVVCFRLWEKHRDAGQIDAGLVRGEAGDVNAALAGFYAEQIGRVCAQESISERRLRDWCELRLVTPQGMRGQLQGGERPTRDCPRVRSTP
jgi:hypothetical protein